MWIGTSYGSMKPRVIDFIRLFFPNVSIFIAPEITQVAQMIPGPGPMENTTILHFLHPTPPENAGGRRGAH